MKRINYDNYYWQNDLVRLRALRQEDWPLSFPDLFDSKARLLLQCEMELPPVEEKHIAGVNKYSNFDPESGRLMFAIETLDGVYVGALNLNSIDERNGTFGIGMQICIEHRGKGYGTAAMRILLHYAFMERRLNKYNCYVLDGNIGSATMLKKLGCIQEGIRREHIYTNGEYKDIILYGLTKKDFIENEKKY